MNDIDSFLRIEISKVYPIENYSGYMKCYKYSDKIVLPLSICYSIIGPRNQFSVIFSIHSKSNYSISALCGVLEFTAEKDAVYCPSYILKKIGFTSLNKCKEGVILEILSLSKNKHLFPKLTQLKVCSSIYIQENTCKRGLLGYTTIKTGDILTILDGNKEVKLYITKTFPDKRCLLLNENFELKFSTHMPFSRVMFENSMFLENETDYSVNTPAEISPRRETRKFFLRAKKKMSSKIGIKCQEVVGRHIEIPTRSKMLSVGKNSKNLHKISLTPIKLSEFPLNAKTIVKDYPELDSDSSVDDIITWDQVNSNLTPIYTKHSKSPDPNLQNFKRTVSTGTNYIRQRKIN